MTRQLSVVAIAAALGLIGPSAWADGMVQHASPPCCEAPFAGGYFGGAIGYGQQRVEIDNQTLGTVFKDTDGGVTLGGYAGYNWQHCCHPVVFGVETDFNWLDTSPTALDIESGGTGLNVGRVETTSLKSQLDWFGTLRGRLGYTIHENWLLYATAGLAYGQLDHTLSDDCVGCGNSAANLGAFSQSNKSTKVGWTVGGGAEVLHDSHWLLRAEALFVDLGSETITYNISGTDLNSGSPASGTATAKWDDQFWVARLGIAYKFDDPRPVVPLK